MGCGCSGSKSVAYVFTPADGSPEQVFNKEIQARVAQVKAKPRGGGTITTRPTK